METFTAKKEAFYAMIKERRETKQIIDKMFSLECDLVWTNENLANTLQAERLQLVTKEKELSECIKAWREAHFTAEQLGEMKKEFDEMMGGK